MVDDQPLVISSDRMTYVTISQGQVLRDDLETDKWNTSCCRVSAVSEFMVFLPLSIKFAVSQKQNIDLIYVLSLYALTPTLAPLALRISSLVPASLQRLRRFT